MASFNLDVLTTHVRALESGEFGVVFRNGNVAADDSVAITATGAAVIRNGGAISSISEAAIEAQGSGLSIENTGMITGGSHAIRAVDGDDPLNLKIVSSGSIIATNDGFSAISIVGHGARLVNFGEIVALGGHGISFETEAYSGSTNSIFNSGEIFARGDGDLAIQGSGASDEIENSGIISGRIVTGKGADRLINSGTVTGDIDLGRGTDVFEGRTGEVLGVIHGGLGNDSLRAGMAGEEMYGDNGHDLLRGGTGSDTLVGGVDRDTLIGGAGDDDMAGGLGMDTIWAGIGDDSVHGGSGSDYLSSGAGDDLLEGGLGWDTLRGGQGDDELFGGGDRDRLNGGEGADTLWGGSEADTFVMNPGGGVDLIGDFSDGEDKINLMSFGLKGFNDLGSRMQLSENSQGARIDFGDGDVLILDGVTIDTLSFADFIF